MESPFRYCPECDFIDPGYDEGPMEVELEYHDNWSTKCPVCGFIDCWEPDMEGDRDGY